ncbi:hypothetical protein ES703_38659 [subsurface metagenome]
MRARLVVVGNVLPGLNHLLQGLENSSCNRSQGQIFLRKMLIRSCKQDNYTLVHNLIVGAGPCAAVRRPADCPKGNHEGLPLQKNIGNLTLKRSG